MDLRTINKNGKLYIFDAFRRKYVVATPEEKVRQQFCAYLVNDLHYPQLSIANECLIPINGLQQRCDTLVYKQSTPILLVEYKAPTIPLSQAVVDQAMRYNTQLHVPYVVICNGTQTVCIAIDYSNLSYHYLPEVPVWEQL